MMTGIKKLVSEGLVKLGEMGLLNPKPTFLNYSPNLFVTFF